MSFEIITGAAGSGKSERLFQKIIASARVVPERTHIVLVPEQATLQTEGRLVAMHPDHVLFNIEVLSFNKLAYRLFDYENAGMPAFLDESGKGMLLRKAAQNRRGSLEVYGDSLERVGVIDHLKATVSELLQYDVSPDRVIRTAQSVSGSQLLSGKLRDLALLYREYLSLKDDETMSAEEIQLRAAALLERSDYLRGAAVAIDGFTGFTPVQLRMIGQLMKRCVTCMAAVTLPPEESTNARDEFDLFSLTKKTIRDLIDTASLQGIRSTMERVWAAPERKRPEELEHLSARFLQESGGKPYSKKTDSLSLTVCRTPSDEAVFVADTIRRLVREEGYRYKDFAVVSADLESSRTTLSRAFREAGIPAFIDIKKGIMDQPISTFLLSAVEIVEKNYPFDAVFRFLKTGLADVTRDETDLLENYVLGTGITGGRRWSEDFTRTYKNHRSIDLEVLNGIRSRAIKPVLAFQEALRGGRRDYRQACAALRGLLADLRIEEKLRQRSQELDEAGEILESRLYAQIYEHIDTLIGQMEAVLGEQTYQLRELKDILKVGLSQLGIGAVPPVIDQVQTGDIRRSRRGRVRVLFLINCIDSNLPAKASEAGIFTDDQREKLAGSGLELAPTARQNTVNERFYLYELVHLPEDRLYVTWSKKDAKGRTVSPSTYIPLLTGLFADLKPGTFESGQWRLPQSETEAKQLLAVNLRELHRDGSPDRIRQLYASLMGDPGQARYLKTVTEAAFYVKRDRHLQRQTVERLYSDRLLMGVSSLERYAACAYRAFLTDVLKLSKRETFSLTAADIGNIDHKLIELFFRRLIEQGIDPGEVDEEVRHSLTGAAMTEVREGYLDYLDDSARYRYYIDRFTRVADRNIWASIEQLKTGSYRPVAIESVFDGRITEDLAIPVDGDRTLLVNGRIDRIDAAPGENGSILRVIDYKTGSQDFDPAAIWHGLSLQLMVYLMAVKGRFRREDLPGGAYYYHIKNPLIAVKKNVVDPELVRREVLGEMKLTGILVDTAESRAADPETTDKGNLQLTPEQLDALMEHTGEKLKTIGRDIFWGRIPVSPCRYRNKKACEYCDYAGVCGFDTRLAGHRYRLFPKMDSEEIMEALRGDENKLDN